MDDGLQRLARVRGRWVWPLFFLQPAAWKTSRGNLSAETFTQKGDLRPNRASENGLSFEECRHSHPRPQQQTRALDFRVYLWRGASMR